MRCIIQEEMYESYPFAESSEGAFSHIYTPIIVYTIYDTTSHCRCPNLRVCHT